VKVAPAAGWLVPLLGMAVLAGGCSSAGQRPPTGEGEPESGQTPPAGQRHRALPADCTDTVIGSDRVRAALNAAVPGSIVCFSGDDLADATVVMIRSGTAAAPIRLVSDGGTVREVQIKANYVTVEGFTVTGGSGVLLEGNGITARNNTVHDTRQGGITCDSCTDSTIEFNTMRHVATNGIDITGSRITVHANTISDTVAVDGGDADGMRFYGTGHRITDNTIFDISAQGYANPPHPDCFQTLDNGKPPTFDVVITGNTCRNVDAQCLIATGDQNGNGDAPSEVSSIVFENNLCANNGAQAVNVRRWPRVVVRHNIFSGPNLTRAVLITEGSTGCTVADNTTTAGRPTVQVDRSSQPGTHVGNDRPG